MVAAGLARRESLAVRLRLGELAVAAFPLGRIREIQALSYGSYFRPPAEFAYEFLG